jgi:Universal stress protein family
MGRLAGCSASRHARWFRRARRAAARACCSRAYVASAAFLSVERQFFGKAAGLGRGVDLRDAQLIALHVSATPRALPVVFSEAGLLRFLQPDFAGLKVKLKIVDTGAVWDRVVDTARVEQADLILMSTHGHHDLADSLLGSNTERVVRHAPCPVLIA